MLAGVLRSSDAEDYRLAVKDLNGLGTFSEMTLGPHHALPLELRSVNAKPLEVRVNFLHFSCISYDTTSKNSLFQWP